MRGFADISYVHAKVYGLRSRLLSRSDYVSLLTGGALDRFFPGLSLQPHPAQCTKVKEDIFRCCICGVLSLTKAMGAYEKLFMAFLGLYEARNVKQLMARALGARPVDGQWYDISPYAAFTRTDSDKVSSWEDCVDLISRSYLGQIVADINRPRFEELEGRLDLHCLNAVFAAAGELSDSDKCVVQQTVLMVCAMLKILWERRLEQLYGWGRTEIDELLAPIKALSAQCRDESFRIKLRLFERRLDSKREPPGDHGDVSYILFEQQAEQELYACMRSLCAADFHSISCVAGYLCLLYCQIRNLFKVIEGIRFSLSAETITAMLICEA